METNSNAQHSFFKELGSFMKKYTKEYTISVFISVLSVIFGIGAYAFTGKIIYLQFSSSKDYNIIIIYLIFAIICKLLNTILFNTSTWISHKAAFNTLRDIRIAIIEKITKLPLGYFEKNGSGRIKTILADQIEGMEKTLAHVLPELTANLLAPLCFMVWMFFIYWPIALITFLWIIAGFGVTFGMMKGYNEKYKKQLLIFKEMNQSIIEYVNGIEVIKNFGRVGECSKKYSDAIYNHTEYNTNWQKETQKYISLGMAVAPFSIFPILISGLYFFNIGSVDAATVLFMSILSFGIFTPLFNSIQYFDNLAIMGENAYEINSILKHKELKRKEGILPDSFNITYNKVNFVYNKIDNKGIKNISFTVPQGTMFALVGPSGSGKSTIAKILAGFWDIDSGEIKIGNTLINNLSLKQLNNIISYVDQDTYLFNGTIMDNIKSGNKNISDEDAINIAKQAGCNDFICNLENGYNTVAGSGGDKLSGGEKQRIAIVRAMVKNAPIMILDEATSSTDPENELYIQHAISEATKGKTLIVIAHRLSTVIHANQIAFVKNGEITAIGTHKELLEKSRDYKLLWDLNEVKEND